MKNKIKAINFQQKRKELDQTINNKPLHSYGIECLAKLEAIFQNIQKKLTYFDAGAIQYQLSILKELDYIENNLISKENYPETFETRELEALQCFFFYFKEISIELRNFLTKKADLSPQQQHNQDNPFSSLLEEQTLHEALPYFNRFLYRLKKQISECNPKPAKVYFAYAWPTSSHEKEEAWVQPFLKTFKHHLATAGVKSTYLDIESNRLGTNIYSSMQKIESSDYVLLFGTKSLLEKHQGGLAAVCSELIHILRKRVADKAQEKNRVLPLLLSGTCQTSFPPEFERYIAIMDWPHDGYIKGFQKIYLELFGLNSELLPPIWDPTSQPSHSQQSHSSPATHQKSFLKKIFQKILNFSKRFFWIILCSLLLIDVSINFNITQKIQSSFKDKSCFFSIKKRHKDFVGREDYLESLNDICLTTRSSEPQIVVLWGEGGIGKSEIAVMFAHKARKKFAFQFQINCDNEATLKESYQRLAKHLQIPFSNKDDFADLAKRVNNYIETISRTKPWLLIFDNIHQNISFPKRGNGRIIITARCKADWSIYKCLHVQQFSEKEALTLMEKIIETKVSDSRKKLIRELDYFPLALTQTAHYIKTNPGMNEKKYLTLLKEDRATLLQAIHYSPNSSLYGTWRIVSKHLKENNPIALDCLYFFSHLYRQKIPASWIKHWIKLRNKEKTPVELQLLVNRALKDLLDWSLICYEADSHFVSLHSLRHSIIFHEAENNTDIIQDICLFFRNMTSEFGDIEELEWNLENWGFLKQLEIHLAWFLKECSDQIEAKDHVYLLNLLGNWKWVNGQYHEGEQFHETALNVVKTSLPSNKKVLANSLKNLGKCLERQGQYKEALILHQQALDLRIQLFGEKHLDVTLSLHNIGWVQYRLGKYEEAFHTYEKVLSLRKQLLCENHLYIGNAIHFLGVMAFHLGQYETAKNYIKDGLAIRSTHLSEHHPDIAHSLHYLARILTKQGHFKQAKHLHEKVLAIRRDVHGSLHPYLFDSMYYIAEVLTNLGNYDKAIANYKKVLKHRRLLYGEEHPHISFTLSEIGKIYLIKNNIHKSLKYHKKALDMQLKLLGKDHPDIANNVCDLGRVMLAAENYEQAKTHFTQAIEINKKNFPSNHPQTLLSIDNLAIALRKQGKYQACLKLHLEVLEERKRLYGNNDPTIACSLSNLGIVYEHLGDYQKSKELLTQALELNKKIFNKENPNIAESYNCLGWLLTKLGQYKEAEECHYKALKLQEKVLGSKHPEIITSQRGYGYSLGKQGKYRDAKKSFQKALSLSLEIFGEDHPTTFRCQHHMGWILLYQNKLESALKIHKKNLSKRTHFYSKTHPYVAESQHYLGHTLLKMNRLDEASRFLMQAIENKKNCLSKNHPDLLKSLHAMGVLLNNKGESAKSKILLEKVLKRSTELYGEQHLELAFINFDLSQALYKLGEKDAALNHCKHALLLAAEHLKTRDPFLKEARLTYKKWTS